MPYDKEQAKLAAKNPSSLGNLVVRDGVLSQYEFQELFSEFSKQSVNELLGQFLVRKNVLTDEKLQLLLIRQEALENGGVEDQHVVRAMRVADQASERVSSGIDDLMACSVVDIKAAGG